MAQSILVKDSLDKFTFLQTNKVVTISLTGTTASAAIDTSGFRHVAFVMPAAWDAADIKLQASTTEDGTFSAVHDADGEVEITGGTSRVITVPDLVASLTFVKFVSSASQGAARSIGVILSY